MEREEFERDPDTGNYYMTGGGFWSSIGKMGSKVAAKLTDKTAKKIASTAAEKLVTKGSEKIGEKTGQLIGDKIYDKFSGNKKQA